MKHLGVLVLTAGLALVAAVAPAPGQPADHRAPARPAPHAEAPAQPVASAPPPLDHQALDAAAAALHDGSDAIASANGKLTLLLIGFGFIGALLVAVLLVQVYVLQRSLGQARVDAIARARPRLLVRHVELEIFEIGRLAKVKWIIENTGNSLATVIEAHATLRVARRGTLPGIPEYDDRNHAVGGVLVEPGRAVPFVQFSRDEIAANEYDSVHRRGDAIVFFYGYMMYVDEMETRRRVGYCRRFEAGSGRFSVVDDPNYEFSD